MTPTCPPLQTNPLPPATPLAPARGVLRPSLPTSSFHFPPASSTTSVGEDHYQYVSSVHQMLKWPAIQQLLASVQSKLHNLDLSTLEREGPAIIFTFCDPSSQALPTGTSAALTQSGGIAIANPAAGQVPLPARDLRWDAMQRLSRAYFDTINLFFPIINRQSFMSETLPVVFNQRFNDSMSSTIAFLVFALGEVVLAGSEGLPVHVYDGRASGVKGGTKDRPPGLDLFNEARRRMGFNLTECSLENVQIFALAR